MAEPELNTSFVWTQICAHSLYPTGKKREVMGNEVDEVVGTQLRRSLFILLSVLNHFFSWRQFCFGVGQVCRCSWNPKNECGEKGW